MPESPGEMPAAVKMITFAPMVDSECSRLVLAHYRIAVEEQDHLFGWGSVLTLFHGGYGRVPLIHGRGVRASGPRKLVDALDGRAGDRRLLPPDPGLRQEIEQSWSLYNGELATHVAAFAYYHLLPAREAMVEAFRRDLTGWERRWAEPTYGLVRWLLSRLMRLTPERAEAARSRIEQILDATDALLKDGRRYLHGNSLTLADLGLLSAAAPIILPPRYRVHVPGIEELPEAYRRLVETSRRRAVAEFIDRTIREVAG